MNRILIDFFNIASVSLSVMLNYFSDYENRGRYFTLLFLIQDPPPMSQQMSIQKFFK